jgi:hypothetical protein
MNIMSAPISPRLLKGRIVLIDPDTSAVLRSHDGGEERSATVSGRVPFLTAEVLPMQVADE